MLYRAVSISISRDYDRDVAERTISFLTLPSTRVQLPNSDYRRDNTHEFDDRYLYRLTLRSVRFRKTRA